MQPAPPTPTEFRELVEAATRFREAATWEHVADDQVFGVLDPERDEIGYASIVGQQGLVPGLILFPGLSGLASLRRMQFDLLPEHTDDVLLVMRSLTCAYEPTARLGQRDRVLLEGADFELQRDEVWPFFVSHDPGYQSWTLVRDYDLRQLLAGVAKSMDCKLLRVHCLARIEAAQELLREHMNELRASQSR